MNKVDIIRAWKDETYRNSLSSEELATIPENPAGSLSIEEQKLVSGGSVYTQVDIWDHHKCIMA